MGTDEGLDRLFTVADAATYLSVSKRSVYRYIDRGHIPASRIGSRSLRIDPADLGRLRVLLGGV